MWILQGSREDASSWTFRVQAGGIKLLRAQVPARREPDLSLADMAPPPPPAPVAQSIDDMAQTTDLGTAESLADTRPPAPRRPTRTQGQKAKGRPRYRPSSRIHLELTPDPVAPTTFGSGVIATRRRANVPWPVIIGAVLAAVLLILLMTR